MAATLARRLLPQGQRIRALQDELLALRGELQMAQGITVLHVATCGHEACGCPPPAELPEDAWVVQLGCRLEAPVQVTPEAIAAATGPNAAGPTAEQLATFQQLMALTKAPAVPVHQTFIPIRR
jgi:hypothetical protein